MIRSNFVKLVDCAIRCYQAKYRAIPLGKYNMLQICYRLVSNYSQPLKFKEVHSGSSTA